jgi:hypothetical protein
LIVEGFAAETAAAAENGYGDRMNKIFKINCGYSVNSVDSV